MFECLLAGALICGFLSTPLSIADELYFFCERLPFASILFGGALDNTLATSIAKLLAFFTGVEATSFTVRRLMLDFRSCDAAKATCMLAGVLAGGTGFVLIFEIAEARSSSLPSAPDGGSCSLEYTDT